MGAVNFSIDSNLIKCLKSLLPLDIFIETGTFHGDSVVIIKDFFKKIYSIELSKELYLEAKSRFENYNDIHIIHGQAGIVLPNIVKQIDMHEQSIVFFLDAHYCVAENTAGNISQCDLLAELNAIKSLNQHSVIIIDDARLFIAPPLAPYEIAGWPSFNDIINILHKISNQHKLMILNDCILFFPQTIEIALNDFAYHHGADWLSIADKSRDYDILHMQLKEKDALINKLHNICQAMQNNG